LLADELRELRLDQTCKEVVAAPGGEGNHDPDRFVGVVGLRRRGCGRQRENQERKDAEQSAEIADQRHRHLPGLAANFTACSQQIINRNHRSFRA